MNHECLSTTCFPARSPIRNGSIHPGVVSHGTVNQHPLFADMSADTPPTSLTSCGGWPCISLANLGESCRKIVLQYPLGLVYCREQPERVAAGNFVLTHAELL